MVINMYFNIIFKTVLLYFFIVVVYRVMGKKEIGKLRKEKSVLFLVMDVS